MYQMFRNQFLSFSMYQSKCCRACWALDTWRTYCGCSQLSALLGFPLAFLFFLASPGRGRSQGGDDAGAEHRRLVPPALTRPFLAGFVQFLQYYYQSGCLYRLRALGERHNMDLTVGKPGFPLLLVPNLLSPLLPGPRLLAASLPVQLVLG